MSSETAATCPKPSHNPTDHPAPEWARDPSTQNVLALTGYGLSLTVHRGHLILRDGIGLNRRERRLTRAQRIVDRIVIIGQTGHISLDAIRWCLDTNIAVVQIDTLGRIGILATSNGRDDARLRRAQALALVNDTAIDAARYLIVEKIRGQHRVLEQHKMLDGDGLVPFVDLADTAPTLKDLNTAEAAAAVRYFQTWTSQVHVRFATQHVDRVPEHWHTYRARGSLIHPSFGARDAADPVNALLNYAYALAETECTIALRTLGLDPAMGILHADKPGRDSLALDLIEPIRPLVDDLVLQILNRRSFTHDDFTETPTGGCRLSPLLACEMAGHLTDLRPLVAAHAERLGQILIDGADLKTTVGTPLTRSAWSKANGVAATKTEGWSNVVRNCISCGAATSSRHSKRCAACWDEERSKLTTANAVALNARRTTRADSLGAVQARTRRSTANSASTRARYAWIPTAEETAMTDVWYDTEIQPNLVDVKLREIQDALGVSDTAAAKMRSARLRPHRRHWLALAALVQEGR